MKNGSKLDCWARRWPRWPSFGPFRPPCGPRWIKMGAKWSIQLFILVLFYEKMALNSTPGPEDGPDGQVLAISGPHVVRDGWKWVQNDPWKFLLYHCVLKKCSKVHPWGSPWPCSSPWCSSEGHKSPDKIFGFSGLVYLPEHAESGHGHVRILVKPT